MNPWDRVTQTFTEYVDELCKEQLASISHMSAKAIDPNGELCKAKHAEWDRTKESKSTAYAEHAHAVGDALKSGIPCPW